MNSRFSYEAFLVIRVIVGFCNGIVYPAVNAILVAWFPLGERNTAYSIAYGGDLISAIIINPIAGRWFITKHNFVNSSSELIYWTELPSRTDLLKKVVKLGGLGKTKILWCFFRTLVSVLLCITDVYSAVNAMTVV